MKKNFLATITLEDGLRLEADGYELIVNNGEVTDFVRNMEESIMENPTLTLRELVDYLDRMNNDEKCHFLSTRSVGELEALYENYAIATVVNDYKVVGTYVDLEQLKEIEKKHPANIAN